MSTNDQQQSQTIVHTPIKKSPDMNDLPNELLISIFEHLKIRDLIQCRWVCKRFMSISNEVKIPELIISNKIENMKDYWFHTNKQFNHKDAIGVLRFTNYRSTFKFDKFLKRLHFRGEYSDYDDLNLNDLTHLEQLKIDLNVPSYDALKVMHINLPNLKMLEIGEQDYDSDQREFYLTTPKLEKLKCSEFDSIHVADPNTIDHLELTFFFNSESASSLKNVQYFKVDWGFLPNDNILSVYPQLTTLVCNKFDSYSDEDDDASMNSLHHYVQQKLKKPTLKIFFQSVELVDTDKIDEYESSQSDLAFQINNYNQLCNNISYNDPLDYNQLMRLVKGTLPDDFYQKYFNIPSVKVKGRVKSQEHLVQFLKRLDYLQTLRLENTFLDQTFYDGLKHIGRLTELSLRGKSSIINYEFLFSLKLLDKFYTDRDLPDFNLVLELFRGLKYFRYINFYFAKEFIAIGINEYGNGNQYSFTRYKDSNRRGCREKLFEKDKMNFDHLVRLINAYKNFRSNSSVEFDSSFVYDE